jgi:hypothetical protein
MDASAALDVCIAAMLPALCFGQDKLPATTSSPDPSPSASQGLPRFGIQVNAGTLGAGIQAATAVTRRSNVRFGFNYFSYSGSTTRKKDNITFDGTLRLESAEVLYDQFIGGGFHVSPGVMIYDGNQGTGNASIPAGQTFTLNDVTYYSATASPVTGTAAIKSRKVAPELLIGFGNLLPRSARHFTVSFDLGVVFQGSPNAKLNLIGSTCTDSPTSGCSPISGNISVQNNIQSEQNKINNDLGPFKYWPVIRVGFGYKF